jgi:hypothetical protein
MPSISDAKSRVGESSRVPHRREANDGAQWEA